MREGSRREAAPFFFLRRKRSPAAQGHAFGPPEGRDGSQGTIIDRFSTAPSRPIHIRAKRRGGTESLGRQGHEGNLLRQGISGERRGRRLCRVLVHEKGRNHPSTQEILRTSVRTFRVDCRYRILPITRRTRTVHCCRTFPDNSGAGDLERSLAPVSAETLVRRPLVMQPFTGSPGERRSPGPHHSSRTSALVITTGSRGASSWKPLRPVATALMASTTSRPRTTVPNTA